jgi:hypothetical protein
MIDPPFCGWVLLLLRVLLMSERFKESWQIDVA